MPAKKKAGGGRKAGAAAAADKQQPLRRKVESFIKDLEEQLNAFVAQWQDDVEQACAAIEREYRMAALSLPHKTRDLKWNDFFESSDKTQQPKADKETAVAASAAPTPVYQQPAAEAVDLPPPDAAPRRTTRQLSMAAADVSVYSLPESPSNNPAVLPVATAKKRTTAIKTTTAKKGRKAPVAATPLASGRGLQAGSSLITPKVPVGATPMNVCRAPKFNEVLWSAKGSPVTTSVARKRLQSHQAPGNADKRAKPAPSHQLVEQLVENLLSEETASSSQSSSAVESIQLDAAGLGLIEQLNRKLQRIVSANRGAK